MDTPNDPLLRTMYGPMFAVASWALALWALPLMSDGLIPTLGKISAEPYQLLSLSLGLLLVHRLQTACKHPPPPLSPTSPSAAFRPLLPHTCIARCSACSLRTHGIPTRSQAPCNLALAGVAPLQTTVGGRHAATGSTCWRRAAPARATRSPCAAMPPRGSASRCTPWRWLPAHANT